MDGSLMHLVFANTPSHDILRDQVFLPSLKDKWNLVNFEFPYAGNGHYGTEGWFKVVVDRFTRCAEFVRNNIGDIAVFADVDIQFLKPCQHLIEKQLRDCEVCFQRDQWEVNYANTGFVAARCSNMMAEYFEYLGNGNRIYTDQNLTNMLIQGNMMPCKYSYLPHCFATELTIARQRLSDIVLYHSTLSVPTHHESCSIDAKIRQHKVIKEIMCRK